MSKLERLIFMLWFKSKKYIWYSLLFYFKFRRYSYFEHCVNVLTDTSCFPKFLKKFLCHNSILLSLASNFSHTSLRVSFYIWISYPFARCIIGSSPSSTLAWERICRWLDIILGEREALTFDTRIHVKRGRCTTHNTHAIGDARSVVLVTPVTRNEQVRRTCSRKYSWY